MAKSNFEPEIKTDEYMDNTPKRVEGTKSLVTWFVHDGKTQIHIATANIREAHFDISIIPVDLALHGHGTDPSESYKDIMPYENKFVVEGDVVWCHKSEDFACKEVVLAVIIHKETVTAPANDGMYKVVRDICKEVKKHNFNTIGIQLNDGYDVSMFVRTLNERRYKQHSEKLSVFLCTHDKNAELTNVVNDIDQLVQKTKNRRLTSPEMHEIFPRLKIPTRIHRGSLLDSGCQCVVAAIGKDLNLKQGGIIKHIADAAGEEIQKYLPKYGDAVQYWKVMNGPVGKLSDEGLLCLLFGCMPKWEKKGDSVHIPKRLAKFILGCLLMADETGCSSIAIPLVGTGRLKYHERTVFVALLDGIELYAQLATLRRIKEVVISLPDIDDGSYKLYVSELQRRGNGQRKLLFKNAKVKVLNSTNTGTKYSIVNAQDLQDQLPIEFVDVVLNNSSGKKGNVLPVMIGGKLTIDSEINQQNFESIMRRVVETCETKKISTTVVYTSRLPAIQAVIQAKGIINASESYKDKIYLYTVVVAVSNADEFTACELFIKDRNIRKIKSITTLNTVNVGPIFILQEECHDDIDGNVYIVNANQSDPEPTDQSNTSERESVLVMDIVTAEINPGVIEYLHAAMDIESWKTKMKSVFALHLFDKDGKMMLEGTLDSILRVEEYFEADFPNDPELHALKTGPDTHHYTPTPNNETDKASTEPGKKKTTKKVEHREQYSENFQDHPLNNSNKGNYGHDLGSAILPNSNDNATGIVKSKINCSSVLTKDGRKKENQNQTPTVGSHQPISQNAGCFGANKGTPYKFKTICVYVYEGDITRMPTETIVCSDDTSFKHSLGLSKRILSRAGNYCLDEWTQMARGNLKENTCIVTAGGRLCQRIIHVIRPGKLENIHQAFSNILHESNRLYISTLAIPTIGVGMWPYAISDCAEQYYKALQGYSDAAGIVNNTLNEIHIVDITKGTIDIVRSVFDRNTSKVSNEPTFRGMNVFTTTVAVTKQDLFSFSTDITVFFTNKHSTEENECMKNALRRSKTLNEYFQRRKGDLFNIVPHRLTNEVNVLNCKSVIVTAWPEPQYRNDGEIGKGNFKRDVLAIVRSILCFVKNVDGFRIAIPLITNSDNDEVKNICCCTMVEEIFSFALTSIRQRTVYVVTDPANYERFCSVLNNKIDRRSHVVHESTV